MRIAKMLNQETQDMHKRHDWTGRLAAAVLTTGLAASAQAIVNDPADLAVVEALHGGVIEHCEAAVASGDFLAMFDCGDELFEAPFNAVDGGGANVGDGGRYTGVPRADQNGPLEWANHIPMRATGPNAVSCITCHNLPVADGAGEAGLNVIRNPLHSVRTSKFIQRNAPHLHGSAVLQVLAEEMNEELDAIVAAGIADVCDDIDAGVAARITRTYQLDTKGVNFGRVEVEGRAGRPCPKDVDITAKGIDEDLVPKPYQWKGTDATLRGFNRGAFHQELGMQPVELTGYGVDGDGDGVVDEISVDDVSALNQYIGAQPRPVSSIELSDLRDALVADGQADVADALGLVSLSMAEKDAIARGEALFEETLECSSCHISELLIDDPIFNDPSENPNYRDELFPSGLDPVAEGLDPADPLSFDLTADQPDNEFLIDGETVHLGPLTVNEDGKAVVRLYGDLKRHRMGSGLAENIREFPDIPRAMWMTENLWGIAETGSFLHDGRATTLSEAILLHGGEAADHSAAFAELTPAEQADVIAFLESLVLFLAELEE